MKKLRNYVVLIFTLIQRTCNFNKLMNNKLIINKCIIKLYIII